MNPRDISTAKNPVMRGSFAALRQAAEMARQTAIQTNTYLVVVRNGPLVKIPPDQLRKDASEKAATDQAQSADEKESRQSPTHPVRLFLYADGDTPTFREN